MAAPTSPPVPTGPVGPAPKVSVVVATYNSPPGLDDLLASLDAQSLPAGEYELVFVDDGSSDDTFARLQRLAADRPHMVVDRIENSGWPGRPRNVGTRLARGDYVFYADHDDYFFPEALERMHRFAVAHELDVLHPKEVVKGWSRPGWVAFREQLPRVPRLDSVVLQCITPHKLYRREFLESADVRFPEGRVRLEDFSLNGLAWARTDAIGVMADYPCYQWIIHEVNSHKASYDFEVYWASFRSSLEPVLALPDGDKKDQLLLRWYRSRVLERVKALDGYDEEYAGRFLDVATGLLALFPPHLDRLLPHGDRPRSVLLRAGDRDSLRRLSASDAGRHLTLTRVAATWVGSALRLDVESHLVDRDREPVRLDRDADGRVRRPAPEGVGDGGEPWVWDLTEALPDAFAEVVLRSRETSVDWMLPTSSRVEVRALDGTGGEGAGPVRLDVHLSCDIDLATAAGGGPLGAEVWDVFMRLNGLGLTPTRRLRADETMKSIALVDGRGAAVFVTHSGHLALDLSGQVRTVAGVASPGREDLEETDAGAVLHLPAVHVSGESDVPVTVSVGEHDHPARLVGHEGRAAIEIAGGLTGHGPVRVRSLDKVGTVLFRLPDPAAPSAGDGGLAGGHGLGDALRSTAGRLLRRVRR